MFEFCRFHAWHVIVREVRLLHHAILDADPLRERETETVNDAALVLRDNVVGMYRDAGIDRALLEIPDLSRDEILRHLDTIASFAG